MKKDIDQSRYIVVMVTAKDAAEAEIVARRLLDRKLAACCNIVKDVRSLYWWQGKVEDSSEVLVVIKARRKDFTGLEKEVRAVHSYSVPEIIALPMIEGSKPYLKWIDQATNK